MKDELVSRTYALEQFDAVLNEAQIVGRVGLFEGFLGHLPIVGVVVGHQNRDRARERGHSLSL